MKPREIVRPILIVGLVAASVAFDWTRPAPSSPPVSTKVSVREQAARVVAFWPEDSRLLALKLLELRGDPFEIAPHYLCWEGPKPFNMTTVYADRESSNHPGILVQTVSYRVPFQRWRPLEAFNRGVLYDVVFNELVAASDSEETNLLALNLADEIIQDQRAVDDARELYDLVKARSYAGKASWYTTALRFDPEVRRK